MGMLLIVGAGVLWLSPELWQPRQQQIPSLS